MVLLVCSAHKLVLGQWFSHAWMKYNLFLVCSLGFQLNNNNKKKKHTLHIVVQTMGKILTTVELKRDRKAESGRGIKKGERNELKSQKGNKGKERESIGRDHNF